MLTTNEYKHVMEGHCRSVVFIAEQITDMCETIGGDEVVVPFHLMDKLKVAIIYYKQSQEDYKTALCKENGL